VSDKKKPSVKPSKGEFPSPCLPPESLCVAGFAREIRALHLRATWALGDAPEGDPVYKLIGEIAGALDAAYDACWPLLKHAVDGLNEDECRPFEDLADRHAFPPSGMAEPATAFDPAGAVAFDGDDTDGPPVGVGDIVIVDGPEVGVVVHRDGPAVIIRPMWSSMDVTKCSPSARRAVNVEDCTTIRARKG
jgi:hypothetical protein